MENYKANKKFIWDFFFFLGIANPRDTDLSRNPAVFLEGKTGTGFIKRK